MKGAVMPLPTLGRNSALIRKAQDCVILLGAEDAPLITAITAGASAALVDFPTTHSAYISLGRHTKEDGLNWSRDINAEDVMSHGVSEPTRRDKTSDVLSVQVQLQETKKRTMELAMGVDLSAVTPTAVTGEISFIKPTAPSTIFYRLLALASDGVGTAAYYYARLLARVSVSAIDAQVWSEASELRTPITFTAHLDDVAGFAVKELWGGPGLRSNLVAMGFPAVT
jgi:hypothetical protein